MRRRRGPRPATIGTIPGGALGEIGISSKLCPLTATCAAGKFPQGPLDRGESGGSAVVLPHGRFKPDFVFHAAALKCLQDQRIRLRRCRIDDIRRRYKLQRGPLDRRGRREVQRFVNSGGYAANWRAISVLGRFSKSNKKARSVFCTTASTP